MIADTSFIIDLMRKKPVAIQKLNKIEEENESQKTTSSVVFELAVGIAMSEWPEKERRKVEELLKRFSVLNLETKHAFRSGLELGKLFKNGNPIDPIDAQIGGLAF
jgi:hypothetical protein